MNKQILALAVASAFIAPAVMADTVNVNVYGRVRAAVESVGSSGATSGNNTTTQTRVVDNSSVLGFKGNEDLGNGLTGMWQVELGLESDGDEATVKQCNGSNDCATTKDYKDFKLASRNTFVALKGGFGSVLLGKYDSPYREMKKGISAPILEDGTSEIAGIFGKYNSGAQSFYTRQNSTLQYTSPTMGGVEFKIGFAPDESKNSATNKTRISTSLGYDNDFMFVKGAYETRSDATGSGATLDSAKAAMLAGGYKFGKNGAVGAGVERLTVGDGDQTNVYVSAHYKFAEAWTVGINYGQAGEANDAAETGASMLAVGGQYDFSKRTAATLYYATIKNDDGANYNFGDNSIDKLALGHSPRVLGLGMSHKF